MKKDWKVGDKFMLKSRKELNAAEGSLFSISWYNNYVGQTLTIEVVKYDYIIASNGFSYSQNWIKPISYQLELDFS